MKKFSGLFIKIGELDHLKSLQNEGLLYCKPLQYFAKLKDEKVKGDNLENVTNMTYYENASMDLIFDNSGVEKIVSLDISGSHKYEKITSHCGNLYCLYSFNIYDLEIDQVGKFNIDNKLGTHALIIHNADVFFNRLRSVLEANLLKYQAGFIDYVNFSNYDGEKNFFQKDIKYSGQKEYRILFHTENESDLKLVIGNLEDITHLFPIEELLNKQVIRPSAELIKNMKSL